jgi:hypothetical protein
MGQVNNPPNTRGVLELGYAFNDSIAASDPGARRISFDVAGFNATNLFISETAVGNFDASTLLSLLQTGNRIYLQQSNNSANVALYQLTAPAVDNGSFWTVPVALVQSRGVLFANNAALSVVLILAT